MSWLTKQIRHVVFEFVTGLLILTLMLVATALISYLLMVNGYCIFC